MSARAAERNAALVERFVDGQFTLAEIAAEFSISKERVRQLLVAHGIRERPGKTISQDRYRDSVLAAFGRIDAGETTTKEEALRLGVSPTSLTAAFRRYGRRLSESARAPQARHGTRYYYARYRCRCVPCVEANRAHWYSLQEQEPPAHGTPSAYSNYRCRCFDCRMAMKLRRKEIRQQRLERET